MLWIKIASLTILELWQSRTYKTLLSIACLAPIAALTLASLFMTDVGKVYMDGIAGISQLLAMVFFIFLVITLLSRDIFGRVCYILLTPPVKRSDYFLGRFLGIMAVFLLLLLVLAVSSAFGGWLYLSELPVAYQSGYAWYHLAQLMFFHYFQYISILGFIFFVISWASGDAEAMLFTVAILLLSWIFPPVLKVMLEPEVAANTPEFIIMMLQGLYEVLPHLQGSEIALSLAHGLAIGWNETMYYALEHSLYGLTFFLLGLLIFNRRDL